MDHLFGRDREVGAFDAIIDDLRNHTDGGALAVIGPPGRGLTHLLRSLEGRTDGAFIGFAGVRQFGALREAVARAAASVLSSVLAGRPGLRDANESLRAVAAISPSAIDQLAGFLPDAVPAAGDFRQACSELFTSLDLLGRTLIGRPVALFLDDVTDAPRDELTDLMWAVFAARQSGSLIAFVLSGDERLAAFTDDALVRAVRPARLSIAEIAELVAIVSPEDALDHAALRALAATAGGEPALVVAALRTDPAAADPPMGSLVAEPPLGAAPPDPVGNLETGAPSPALIGRPASLAELPLGAAPPDPDPASGDLPTLRGSALRYMNAVVRLGEDATDVAVARTLGDTNRLGGGSAFDSVRDELTMLGILWRSADGRLVVADRRVLAQLTAQ